MNENGKRSYEAYIMTPGMTKDDIKYEFSLVSHCHFVNLFL